MRGIRKAAPPAVLALLCAGAFAGFGEGHLPLPGAGLDVLTNVGANTLTDVILRTIDRVRDNPAAFEEMLAEQLEARLAVGDERLSGEIAEVLKKIDAGGVVLETMRSQGAELREDIEYALRLVTSHYHELDFILTSIVRDLDQLSEEQARQGSLLRLGAESSQQQLAELALIREQVTEIARSRPGSPGGKHPRVRWRGGCPYRGLQPFRQSDADVFYGREQRTAELIAAVRAKAGGSGLLLVTGVSGAGKSSLLRAGLMAALSHGNPPGADKWRQEFITPTRDPLTELATVLATPVGLDVPTLRDRLAQRPEEAASAARQAVLADASRGHADRRGERRMVLIVDQFEELFTLGEESAEEEREAFVAALDAMTRGPAVVIVAVRGDFVDRMAAYPPLASALADGLFVVGPMTGAELRRAITGPAAAAGLETEEGLVTTILGDLRTSGTGEYDAGALPLLSEALRRTYEVSPRRMSIRAYDRVGGVANAVRESAEEVYTSLTEPQKVIARALFLRMVSVSGPESATRRPLPKTDTYAAAPDDPASVDLVLQRFMDKRLMTVSGDVRESSADPKPQAEPHLVEISHDVLLTAWPRLKQWIEPHLAAKVLIDQLDKDAADWAQHGDRAFLYRGAKLAALLDLRTQWQQDPQGLPAPAPAGEDFLRAGIKESELSGRIRRLVIGGLSALLVMALVATSLAVWQGRQAELQRQMALVRLLVADAANNQLQDPATGRLLVAAAARLRGLLPAQSREELSEVDGGLYQALVYAGMASLKGHNGAVLSVAFNHDGTRLATGSDDNTVRLWDTTGAAVTEFKDEAWVTSVAFNHNGTQLATGSNVGVTRVWDTNTRKIVTVHKGTCTCDTPVTYSGDGRRLADGTALLDASTGSVIAEHPIAGSVAFNHDGTFLAIGFAGALTVWHTLTHKYTNIPLDPASGVIKVAFSRDGTRLATGYEHGGAAIWDTSAGSPKGRPLVSLKGIGRGVTSVAFSPDGTRLVTGHYDDIARIWNAGTGALLAELKGHSDAVFSVAFNHDGTRVATGGGDETARIWDATTGTPIAELPQGIIALSRDGGRLATEDSVWDTAAGQAVATLKSGLVEAAAFGHDGTLLATAADGTVRVRNPATGVTVTQLPGFRGHIGALALDAKGARLAIGGPDSVVHLRDLATGKSAELMGHAKPVNSLDFTRDGTYLATGSEDGTARVWNVATGVSVTTLKSDAESVMSVAFNPDGTRLATGSFDGTVRIWDVATGLVVTELKGQSQYLSAVAFNANGTRLATGSSDGTARVWELGTGKYVEFRIHSLGNLAILVAFSKDGTHLVAAANKGRTWDTPFAATDLMRELCSRMIVTSLSAKLRDKYGLGAELEHPCDRPTTAR
ncbi:WD40 repeat domain-containing protein [Nonomuraea guangzhouensis]|uniref:AAA family ATPase n=1 Tax=Nonomuraea guangzhouensis TaxID=1291555 RepID=A0ABW4GIM0_9ACTN|nr:WD40 repeat domain-containing protein [Nonomuraea guangzhouensis]